MCAGGTGREKEAGKELGGCDENFDRARLESNLRKVLNPVRYGWLQFIYYIFYSALRD